MCIIVDTNTLANVFESNSAQHSEFKPVLDWVLIGKGTFIYGGSKYLSEVGKTKYLPLFSELNKAKKAKNMDRAEVDRMEAWATEQVRHPDFDDQHLVGLLLVSGCKIICSLDKRAYDYFTNAIFFNPSSKRPKIYSRRSNADLLTDDNMAAVCKPGFKLTAAQRKNYQ